MESKNNIIVTVLLVIIIIGLIGFILYDKVLKKDVNINNTTSNVEENNNKEEIQKEISIVDAVNYSYNFGNVDSNPKINVRLPKIEGDTKTVEELNKKILNEILPKTNMYTEEYYTIKGDTDSDKVYSKGANVTYNYKIQNNVLVINIFDDVPEGSITAGLYIWCDYLYDIDNDRILSVKEAAQKLGLENDYNEIKEANPEVLENAYAISIGENGLEVILLN